MVLSGGRPAAGAEAYVWSSQCLGGESLEGEVCTTEITVRDGERDFVIYFVHSPTGQVPLVAAGEDQPFTHATVKVDDQAPIDAERCETGACFFAADTSATLIKQFRRGRKARVTMTARDAGVVLDKVITLRGFTAALAAYRPRPRSQRGAAN